MDHAQARASRSTGTPRTDETDDLPAYCSRPKCRQELRHQTGPGRRKAFCSDICRRTAEKELRQVRSRLQHFEALVQQLRIDLAAFGRTDEADGGPSPIDAHRQAEDALSKAEGALMFLEGSDEPAARALRALFDAVAPVVRQS